MSVYGNMCTNRMQTIHEGSLSEEITFNHGEKKRIIRDGGLYERADLSRDVVWDQGDQIVVLFALCMA